MWLLRRGYVVQTLNCYQLVSVRSMRPESSHIQSSSFIPPRTAPTTVCDIIHHAVARIQTQHLEAFIAITGDFNHVSLSSCLTGFVQYVDCPTRGEKTLACYINKYWLILIDPLHSILAGQRSSWSERLISLHCRTEKFRRFFVPTAIRLFNSDCWHVLLKFLYLFISSLIIIIIVLVLV